MRAGTSRGAFLRAEDLPADPALREKVILGIYGSPDLRQIDGLGGATSLTSKVAIVGPSTRDDADVDYTFGQVLIGEPRVDFSGNCGNISSGVAPFAIDEGLVRPTGPVSAVRVHMTNTNTVLVAEVGVRDGICPVMGDAEVAGVPGSGASILLDWGAVGGTLGKGLLPTGSARQTLDTAIGPVNVSIVDAGNVACFIEPAAAGLTGRELTGVVMGPDLLDRIEAIRGAAAQRLGFVQEAHAAAVRSPNLPKLYFVAPPEDYRDSVGRQIAAGTIDIIGRGMSIGFPHQAYAATISVCTVTAALIPGTIVHAVARPAGDEARQLRIGHPAGIMVVQGRVGMRGNERVLERAAVVRTARRIMEGTVYVPLSRLV
jgi:2-methylaconitate cis-trans-isomerase PrpF